MGCRWIEISQCEPWFPNRPQAAGCRVSPVGTIVSRAKTAHHAHGAPHVDCTCGVYAAKSLEHLRRNGYSGTESTARSTCGGKS
jgi:hypothetical protein